MFADDASPIVRSRIASDPRICCRLGRVATHSPEFQGMVVDEEGDPIPGAVVRLTLVVNPREGPPPHWLIAYPNLWVGLTFPPGEITRGKCLQ
jgi:hypothetical protein